MNTPSARPAAVRAEPPAVAGPGLVICAKTRREAPDGAGVLVPDDVSGLLGEVYRPAFASPELVEAAAGLFERLPAWSNPRTGWLVRRRGQAPEGPRPRLVVSPGSIRVRRVDLAKAERTQEREHVARAARVAGLARELEKLGEFAARPSRREISGWSAKSRANMTEAFCQLDYSGWLVPGCVPAMLTLTYPGEWLVVAPNGRAVKAHMDKLRKRYARAWGGPLVGIWKLEFHRRGAPHVHMLIVPPAGVARVGKRPAVGDGLPFRQWVSAVWADVVDHPDPEQRANHLAAGTAVDIGQGLRSSDPKRVAIYFGKHGAAKAKEYQHILPPEWRLPGQGPGRWWGYWGLRRIAIAVEVPDRTAVLAARTLRRWSHAQQTTREVRAPRTRGGRVDVYAMSGPVVGLAGALLLASLERPRTRKVRRRAVRLTRGVGWLACNDGPAMASQVHRSLSVAAGVDDALTLAGIKERARRKWLSRHLDVAVLCQVSLTHDGDAAYRGNARDDEASHGGD